MTILYYLESPMRCMDESATPLTTKKWEEKTQRFDIKTFLYILSLH